MSIDDVLSELRKTYLAALPKRAALIESLWKEHRYTEVESEFHKLKGTGKTYGLPEVSQIGELAERLCEAGSTFADNTVPAAVKIIRRIHDARAKDQVLALETDADFQALAEIGKAVQGQGPATNTHKVKQKAR